MLFHARSLEMYTQCYDNLTVMSEDNDMEVRCNLCVRYHDNIDMDVRNYLLCYKSVNDLNVKYNRYL